MLDLVDTLWEEGYTNFTAAYVTAGMDAYLASLDTLFMVFAPTDDAFGNVKSFGGKSLLECLLEQPFMFTLRMLLSYHVAVGAVSVENLSNYPFITTLAGPLLITIDPDNDNLLFSNSSAGVVQPDIFFSNGIAHGVDAFLLPPGEDFDSFLQECDDSFFTRNRMY